jgi:hypothetical protein
MVTDWFTPSVEEDKVAVMPDGMPSGYILMAEPAEGQVRATLVVPPGATVMVPGVKTMLQLGNTFTATFIDAVWFIDPLEAVTLKP